MAGTANGPSAPGRAKAVLVALGAVLVLGLVLVVAFSPGVQTVDAPELIDRKGEARAFLIADLIFVALYAVALPIALRRFARTRAGVGRTIALAAAGLLPVAGLADLIENVLLLIATGSESQGLVDAAHAVAIPKVAFFLLGAVPALVAGWFAATDGRRASAA